MNSGAYREKITIEQGTVSVDSIGNRTTTWTTFWRGFAYVNMLSGSEYWAAAQVKAEETVQFVLRYSTSLRRFRVKASGAVPRRRLQYLKRGQRAVQKRISQAENGEGEVNVN